MAAITYKTSEASEYNLEPRHVKLRVYFILHVEITNMATMRILEVTAEEFNIYEVSEGTCPVERTVALQAIGGVWHSGFA